MPNFSGFVIGSSGETTRENVSDTLVVMSGAMTPQVYATESSAGLR
jgi:hypothetical protein